MIKRFGLNSCNNALMIIRKTAQKQKIEINFIKIYSAGTCSILKIRHL